MHQEQMMFLTDLFPTLGAKTPRVDGRNPHATKKGPGRKAAAGHKKAKRKVSNRFLKRQVNKVKPMNAQTDTVTNTPLKAATRGV
jgi:hypothetical protein